MLAALAARSPLQAPAPADPRRSHTASAPTADHCSARRARPRRCTRRSRWQPAAWSELPGWQGDRTRDAWLALQRSCERLPACAAARRALRGWRAVPGSPAPPAGRRRRRPRLADAALAALPRDSRSTAASAEGLDHRLLRAADRCQPHAARRNARAAVRAASRSGNAQAYWYTRQQIDTLPAAQAALRGREIAYVADPLDALMLQSPGLGPAAPDRCRRSRCRLVRLAFAGHNDQPYLSVGRWLIDQGELRPGEASWPAIRDWARRNPRRVSGCCGANPRVVFFREEAAARRQPRPARRPGRAADARALDRGRPDAACPTARRSGSTPPSR